MDLTIEAEHLSKAYGKHVGVDDVSFTARAGDIVGLLGPNGAGKTTTVRLLTAMLAPSSGTFRIAGAGADQPEKVRRNAGVLPESAGYPGHLTGREYLCRYGRLCGLSRDRSTQVAAGLLADVGLTERADTLVRGWSRGMRQRLGIARALVNDPAVVFLDEPTLGLDPAGQRQILELVRDLAQRRRATVLLSTHTLPDVEDLCSSVLILNRGKVVASGTVADIIRTAAAPRTIRLRVPHDEVSLALTTLLDLPGADARLTPEGSLTASLPFGSDPNEVLRAVLAAGVTLLDLTLDGARLADAFLAITS